MKLMESNEKLSSQFVVIKKVNTLLEKRATELEKRQAKADHIVGEIILKSLVSLMKS